MTKVLAKRRFNYACTRTLAVFLISSLSRLSALEAPLSPAGYWKSYDDISGLADAEVRIIEEKEQIIGTVVRDLMTAATDKPQLCEKCPDERKGRPVIGMEIIRYARYNAAADAWENGQILDPDEGKIYRLKLKVIDGGRKLEVRGYSGVFYRTQIWERLPSPSPAFTSSSISAAPVKPTH